MELKTTTTKEVRLSADDVREAVANAVSDKLGVEVKPSDVKLSISDGDPGGYGSWGDPKHVYNPPTPASFNGATVTVVTKD